MKIKIITENNYLYHNFFLLNYKVYDDWARTDTEYIKFIEIMKKHCFSLRYNIETIKCYIKCKSQWYDNQQNLHFSGTSKSCQPSQSQWSFLFRICF